MPRRAEIDVAVARQLRDQGATWGEIGAVFQVTGTTIRLRLDEHYATQRRAAKEVSRSGVQRQRDVGNGSGYRAEGSDQKDVRILEMVGPDTRTMQQKFFGDPMPGRSALDRRPR